MYSSRGCGCNNGIDVLINNATITGLGLGLVAEMNLVELGLVAEMNLVEHGQVADICCW